MNYVELGIVENRKRKIICNRHRDKDLQKGTWTDVMLALESGNISDGTLNGITFNGTEIKIGNELHTNIAYYQADDGNLIDDSSWIVCGFNGAIPEYVKYITDSERYFIKSTNEDNKEHVISEGDNVFIRTWNKDTLDYTYSLIGAIKSLGSETFSYGSTNDSYGTTAISTEYSVPLTITIQSQDREITAQFAGQNMQLLSKYLYLDCDACDSYESAKSVMLNSKQYTTMKYGNGQKYADSNIRGFLNGTMKPTDCFLKNGTSEAKQFTAKHTFIEKVSVNRDAFLPNVCTQLNRTWSCSDKSFITSDRFWLPGFDFMKSVDSVYDYCSPVTDYFYDSIYGLCEEKEFNKHLSPVYINGSSGYGSSSRCWLRSCESKYNDTVGALIYGKAGSVSFTYDEVGFTPACTIG